MANGNRLLYMIHVNWDWIKQRPQYIAEQLSRNYDVIVLQRHQYRRQSLRKNDCSLCKLEEIPRLPTLNERINLLVHLNNDIGLKRVNNLVENIEPEIIWISGPAMMRYMPANYSGKVVYDCMDDHIAMCRSDNVSELYELERALVERADLIIVSSEHLRNVINERYLLNIPHDHIIRNGFDAIVEQSKWRGENERRNFKLCYIGTIGAWFDFSVIKTSLEIFPDIEYKIIGPIKDGVCPLDDERIEYIGPISHNAIKDYIGDVDCFIMPFVVNEVVLSVDPVKLYEYINFGKDIICINYPEVRRFEPYAFLYDTPDGYCKSIELLKAAQRRRYSDEDRSNLLSTSTWHARGDDIIKLLR